MKKEKSRVRKGVGCLLVVGIILGAILLVRPGLLLEPLAGVLIRYQPPNEPVDVIAILGGQVPDRALQGKDLYNAGKAKSVILFKDVLDAQERRLRELGVDFPDQEAVNRQLLVKFGVPADRIVVAPGDVNSTWEEAEAFARYAKTHGIRSATITTCVFHSNRSYLNFQKALGPDFRLFVVPSAYCEHKKNGWWRDRDQIKYVYVEFANLIAFYLGRR